MKTEAGKGGRIVRVPFCSRFRLWRVGWLMGPASPLPGVAGYKNRAAGAHGAEKALSSRGMRVAVSLVSLLLSVWWCCPAAARMITDMAGRQVEVPDAIRKVYGASPPATYMVYALDPERVAGLNFPFDPSEKEYLDSRMEQLPVIGGWFGQGRSGNLETLLRVRPDIILIWMWKASAVNEKIEDALKPLNIPIVYIVLDSLAEYPAAFRFLGVLFSLEERAETLGRYAEQTLERVARVREGIPASERVSVYYAEGPDGLSTECHHSVHAQLIPLSGGVNVHRCTAETASGMLKIAMEQVLGYNPQVIVSHDAIFLSRVQTDAKWQSIRAVQSGRVYRIPRKPFNWFDRPPSFMRLLGIHWMMNRLYPERYPIDLAAETRHFYRLFLNVDLDDAAVRGLLQP